jgi:hypothetical protein
VYIMPRRVMQTVWLLPQVTTAGVISSSKLGYSCREVRGVS